MFENPLLYSIFWVFAAFWISKAIIPILLLISKEKHLFDDGDDERKMHNGLIPTLGGVAIFAAIIIAFSASPLGSQIDGYGYIVSASMILFAAGLKDDLLIISANKKLVSQLLAVGLIIFGADIYISNLGGVFGIEEVSGWVGIPLTFFTMIVVINSMNLIDGIDGLAGSLGIFAALFFGYWFYAAGFTEWALLAFTFSASVMGFLWFNWSPAKIFMGDTGSLIVGFFLSVLAVQFVELSVASPAAVSWQGAAPIVVAAVLAVPLYDTLRVFILRAIRGNSPFDADSEHVHHHILRAGLDHKKIVLILLSLNSLILATVILLSFVLSNTLLLLYLLSVSTLILPTNKWKRQLLSFLAPPSISDSDFFPDFLEPVNDHTKEEPNRSNTLEGKEKKTAEVFH